MLGKYETDGRRPRVLIGKDTRVSGYLLESCLEAGFTSVGVDVVMVGPMPTAGVAYLAKALNMSAGVVPVTWPLASTGSICTLLPMLSTTSRLTLTEKAPLRV